MPSTGKAAVTEIFNALGGTAPGGSPGLAVTSPADGAQLAQLSQDSAATVREKITGLKQTQKNFHILKRAQRAAFLEGLSAAVRQQREQLGRLITLEGGKTAREGLQEADSSADVILKTIKDAELPEFGGMLRCKERAPVGVVGLITSFNFPLVVANWTLAPALLAGNAVLWKPSEKTPLTALGYKAVFDKAMGPYAGLLQVVVGGREVGEALVADEEVDLISATGSVAMGEGIKATLLRKKNYSCKPILELGGNNGVILSDKISPSHLEWSLHALLNSFLGTSGQRCTNTRRLIVHASLYAQAAAMLQQKLEEFVASGAITSPLSGAGNDYGYGPLVDRDAYERFERAKRQVVSEGGKIALGRRLLEGEYPDAYYVEPALALLPAQTKIMHEETFAPLLFVVPYEGDIEQAVALLNAPANAGLVGGLYTQSQKEADAFARLNQAGHGVINSPKGTGTPAFGMGFGGNKDSGEGEILNSADPLRAFTRDGQVSRIAQNKDIVMDRD